ncbi:hypothetical protein E2P64_00125 [Candidatus Bathyarchaeota archaeon]|nr:hypothetical protein E2P64_00125 [Candidatus Bathyarchaeota archaeon]
MQTLKVALDLDRVIFDTNTYFHSLEDRLHEVGKSFKEIFKDTPGRKSIDHLFDILKRDFHEVEIRQILFGDADSHMSKKMKSIAASVIAVGGDIFIVSVGNRYQLEKLVGFPHSKVFIVKGDGDKVEKAAAMGVDLFVDDKASVVKELRARGVNALQALWFLDDEHQRDALRDALRTPDELEERIVKLLNTRK